MNFVKISDSINLFCKLASEYSLSEMKKDWDQYAEMDPYYAIIRDPDKKGKWSEKEFYNYGSLEIKGIIKKCKDLELVKNKNIALDFGCGIGRLTEPLSEYFKKVIGVDISDNMINLAKSHADKLKIKNIEYKALESLSSIKSKSVDLILTRFVFEHIPPNFVKKYIKEFTRILKTGGVITFDMPFDEPKKNTKHNKKYIEKGKEEDVPITLVFSIPKKEIYEIIKEENCYIVDSNEINTLVNKNFPAGFYWISK